MIVDNTNGLLEKVKASPQAKGITDSRYSLDRALEYLGSYGEQETRCLLYPDFAPLSFAFVMETKEQDGSFTRWFNGGLIFHGPADGFGSGAAPTFSVTLEPTHGWSVHT